MRIREYTSADLDDLRRMHAAQGFGYPLPDLDSPMFVSKLVLEEEDDEAANPAADEETHAGNDEGWNGKNGGESRSGKYRSRGREEARGSSPRVTMAILQRLTAETYLLQDPASGTPRQRWQRFLALHEAARRDAAARGLDDAQAFLPPRIARAFGRRLARLGWTRDPWPCFSRRVL